MIAFGGAGFLAVILFLLIPLTQMLDSAPEPDLLVRETSIILPAPEPPPPPPLEQPAPEPQLVAPQMPAETPPVETPLLDLKLSPGAGEAIAMGVAPVEFSFQGQGLEAVQSYFTFDDLNETPRLISTPRFRFPQQLARRGVTEGKVIVDIEILPDGQARFHRIISSTDYELEAVARQIISQARFSIPIVDGRPATVRGHFPLVLQN